MSPLQLQHGDRIDIGVTAPVIVTVIHAAADTSNPAEVHVTTRELHFPLLIPADVTLMIPR